jgi:hypothetical protein
VRALHNQKKDPMKRKTLRINGLLAAAVAVGLLAPVQAVADGESITLCHATDSAKKPYRPITTDESSILKKDKDGKLKPNGHGLDTGPVFSLSGGKHWGDIIPAFDYLGVHFGGLNVPDGQAWLENSCVSPAPSTDPSPDPSPSPDSAFLTLATEVLSTHGGKAEATDWTLTAAGPVTIAGSTGSTFVTDREVPAGTFTLSESAVAGYTPSAWVCGSEPAQTGSTVTLAAGESATCTITNTDQATNGNGGGGGTGTGGTTSGTTSTTGTTGGTTGTTGGTTGTTGGTTTTTGGTTTTTGTTGSASPTGTNPIVAPVVHVNPASPIVSPVVEGATVSPTLAYTGANGVVPLGIFGLIALVLGAVLTVAAHRPATSGQPPATGSTELPPARRGSAVTGSPRAHRAPACRAAATRRRDRRIQSHFSAHRRMPPLVRRRTTCWVGSSRERR